MSDFDKQLCTKVKDGCKAKSKDPKLEVIFKEIMNKKECDCSPIERAIKALKDWNCSKVSQVCDSMNDTNDTFLNAADVEMENCDDAPDSPPLTHVKPSQKPGVPPHTNSTANKPVKPANPSQITSNVRPYNRYKLKEKSVVNVK